MVVKMLVIIMVEMAIEVMMAVTGLTILVIMLVTIVTSDN